MNSGRRLKYSCTHDSAQEQRRFKGEVQGKRVYILSIFILGSICLQCSLSYKGDQLLWGQLGLGWLIVKSQMSMTNADLHADCLSALFYLVIYLFLRNAVICF